MIIPATPTYSTLNIFQARVYDYTLVFLTYNLHWKGSSSEKQAAYLSNHFT